MLVDKKYDDIVQQICDNYDFSVDNAVFFITGSTGMIGEYIAKSLLYLNSHNAKKYKVINLVRDIEKAKKVFKEFAYDADLEFIQQDVTERIVYNGKVDYIIHAAGNTSTIQLTNLPVEVIKTNVIGTYNILEFAKEKNLKSMLFISSGAVYGNSAEFPLREDFNCGGIDIDNYKNGYAESKRIGETMCISYYRQYNIPVRIVRPFIIYGPNINLANGGVFADLAKNVLLGENILLKSDGTKRRNLCYISDAIEAFFRVLFEGNEAEVYNIGNKEATISILELATIINSIRDGKKSIQLNQNIKDVLPTSEYSIYPSLDKIYNLGWKPKIELIEGIKRVVSFLEDKGRELYGKI